MRLRWRASLNHLKLLQRTHHFNPVIFHSLLQYCSLHQCNVTLDESITFLTKCRHNHRFPHFISNPLIYLDKYPTISPNVFDLKCAILSTIIAERRRERGKNIGKLPSTHQFLVSNCDPAVLTAVQQDLRAICDHHRQELRRHLRKKYDALPMERRRPVPSFIKPDAVPPLRTTTLNTKIDSNSIALLNLGPSFVVKPKIDKTVLDSVLVGFHRYAHQLKWRHIIGPTVPSRETSLRSTMPFPKSFASSPCRVPDLEPLLSRLQTQIIDCYHRRSLKKYQNNLTMEEQFGLHNLMRNRNTLRISTGDKSGTFVVMPRQLDIQTTDAALSDHTVYQETTRREFARSCKVIRTTMQTILSQHFEKKTMDRLIDQHPTAPTMYHLVKTHKFPKNADLENIAAPNIKLRPIISACGGPADRLCWLLVHLLSPLFKHVPAHLDNVGTFLSELNSTPFPNGSVYQSFDAVALYTNVDNAAAVDATMTMITSHRADLNFLGLSSNDVKTLLLAALDCSIFRFNNTFYKQLLGLSMGIRLAPLMAVIFLDHLERTSLTIGIHFYKRYIDDVFVIATNERALRGTLRALNSQDVNIRFTTEDAGPDGYLPFLNTSVRVRNGTLEHRWYKKEASGNVLIHSRSAHPMYMKSNVIRNLHRTVTRCSSHKDNAVTSKIAEILDMNGYTQAAPTSWSPITMADGAELILPFIDDNLSKEINTIVKNLGLPTKLIFIPSRSLKDILTSSKCYEKKCERDGCTYCSQKAKICQLSGTIYSITCAGCNQEYIGETGRPLWCRLDEHRRAFATPQSYISNAFSKHRTSCHPAGPIPSWTIDVLRRHVHHTLSRKILEAKELKLRKPEINNKEELANALQFINTT